MRPLGPRENRDPDKNYRRTRAKRPILPSHGDGVVLGVPLGERRARRSFYTTWSTWRRSPGVGHFGDDVVRMRECDALGVLNDENCEKTVFVGVV